MRRGTTPIIRFNLPVAIELLDAIEFTIEQNRVPVLSFGKDRVEKDDNSDITHIYYVRMTQEETLFLQSGIRTYMQVRFRTNFGDVWASRDIPVNIDRILKDGVI